MAATWKESVFHGAGPTKTDWTDNGKYHKADTDPTTDVSATAVVVPAAGSNYSWTKYTKSEWTTAPSGKIMNLRFFSTGSIMGTGVDLMAKSNTTYTQPGSGDETVDRCVTTAASFTAGSPLVFNAGGDILVGPSTGVGTQDYLETQLRVGTTAAPGNITGYTLTKRYDES